MVIFEIQRGYFKVWDGKTSYDCYVDAQRDFPNLPELDEVYQLCQAEGLTQEQTIEVMLSVFHTRRLFKGGYLKNISLVFGFVGPRGSGKSVGASALAIIDFLLDGKTVWSNMDIEITVKYRDCEKVFRSEPLDKASLMDINDFEANFADGLIMIDELNIEIGDARRSMANQMLWFDFMLQEVRKRKMNICYQLQAEEWAGNRSRWQTDFYIVCRDRAFMGNSPKSEDIGRFSRWRIHDMSGIVTGELKWADGYHKRIDHFAELTFWNTPFWNCYNTGQIQKYQKYDPAKAQKQSDGKLVIDEVTFSRLTAGYSVLPELVARILDIKGQRVLRDDIWEILGVTARSEQTKIGTLLRSLGCEEYRDSNNKRGYILPDKEALAERLQELGVETL